MFKARPMPNFGRLHRVEAERQDKFKTENKKTTTNVAEFRMNQGELLKKSLGVKPLSRSGANAGSREGSTSAAKTVHDRPKSAYPAKTGATAASKVLLELQNEAAGGGRPSSAKPASAWGRPSVTSAARHVGGSGPGTPTSTRPRSSLAGGGGVTVHQSNGTKGGGTAKKAWMSPAMVEAAAHTTRTSLAHAQAGRVGAGGGGVGAAGSRPQRPSSSLDQRKQEEGSTSARKTPRPSSAATGVSAAKRASAGATAAGVTTPTSRPASGRLGVTATAAGRQEGGAAPSGAGGSGRRMINRLWKETQAIAPNVRPAAAPAGTTSTAISMSVTDRRNARIAEERSMMGCDDADVSSLGEYEFGKLLGEGAYGKVKLGTHHPTGAKVAVKTFEKAKLADTVSKKRVGREIKNMKMLHHPHVIRLLEVLDSPHRVYLVMELAQQGDMCKYVRAKRKLDEVEARRLFIQMLGGLDYMHQKGLIHRDIKLDNLLLDSNHNIKIVDFGFSVKTAKGEKLKKACGSPSYAAPEIVTRKEYEGSRVDVWSLGVVLFAMVCGYFPFQANTTQNLCRRIASGKFTCPAFLSPECRDLITRMLQVRPDRRATLKDIWQHAWVRMDARAAKPQLLAEGMDGPVEVNHAIMRDLEEKYEVDVEKAQHDIEKRKYNRATTLYFLLDMSGGYPPASSTRRIASSSQLQDEDGAPRQATVSVNRLAAESDYDERTKLLRQCEEDRRRREQLREKERMRAEARAEEEEKERRAAEDRERRMLELVEKEKKEKEASRRRREERKMEEEKRMIEEKERELSRARKMAEERAAWERAEAQAREDEVRRRMTEERRAEKEREKRRKEREMAREEAERRKAEQKAQEEKEKKRAAAKEREGALERERRAVEERAKPSRTVREKSSSSSSSSAKLKLQTPAQSTSPVPGSVSTPPALKSLKDALRDDSLDSDERDQLERELAMETARMKLAEEREEEARRRRREKELEEEGGGNADDSLLREEKEIGDFAVVAGEEPSSYTDESFSEDSFDSNSSGL